MLKLFLTFFKISALTIGGGYAMVPVIQKNLEKKGWMSNEDFYTLLTIAQALPGPIAFNISWLTGKKLNGFKGALFASLGVMIPPFFAIVLASSIIMKYQDNIYLQRFLRGAYGALLGMISGLVYKLYKNQSWNLYKIMLIIFSLIIVYMKSDLMIPIFVAIVLFAYIKENRGCDKKC